MLNSSSIEKLYVALGDRIKNKREQFKPILSQKKLAALVGISRSSLVNIERGRQRTPLHIIYSIAENLNVEVSEIIPKSTDLDKSNEQLAEELKNNPDLSIEEDESIDKLKLFLNRTKQKSYE